LSQLQETIKDDINDKHLTTNLKKMSQNKQLKRIEVNDSKYFFLNCLNSARKANLFTSLFQQATFTLHLTFTPKVE
jgi:SUMO ligase MMS21 Smc5/6 complex component